MNRAELSEINLLWKPLRPYLMRQIRDLYGRTDGDVLEIGPFSGLIFAFAQENVGDSFTVAAFPEETLSLLKDEADSLHLTGTVTIRPSNPSLHGIPDEAFDLVIFRGALFFPGLFDADFRAVYRVLSPGGLAFVGGGFGSYTPPDVVAKIRDRSKELNLAMGKVGIDPDGLRRTLAGIGLSDRSSVITDGGLWVVLRK